jgi:2-iminobutanoate/2-iminopropanoate deaminase
MFMSSDKTITIKGAPEPRGPYVHARQHGGLVYVTAQIGRDPKTGDFVEGGFAAEFNQAIDNVEAILKAAGTSLERVVKAQIEFVDESDLDAMNRIYGERFHEPLPARTSFGAAFLWKGAKVQIDCIAALD